MENPMITTTAYVEKPSASHAVWVSEQARIASFHQVEGYRIQTFTDHTSFIAYLYTLQLHGYRFQ